ncbi:MAG: endolytic transglycosylase MltG [Methylococcales bacterium]
MPRRTKKNSASKIIGFLLMALSLVILVAIFALSSYQRELYRPLSPKALRFEIMRGDSLNKVADRLVENKILEGRVWFKASAMLEGISNQLKAGEYVALPGITLRELLRLVVSGPVQQHSIVLVEGWNYRQVLKAVCNHPAIVNTVCDQNPPDFSAVFGNSTHHPEGRFFPDTYYLTKGTTDIDFLKRAASRMNRVLEQEWRTRSANLPVKSSYEALILASIIEKETARADERPEISGVFSRRMEQGMLLQTDPTVIYGIGERFDGNIRSADLVEDTPYNTYVRAGLPPTPISMPGTASIHAAVHPNYGDFLYFVARGDGTHYFSATREEHERAVNEYQLGRRN